MTMTNLIFLTYVSVSLLVTVEVEGRGQQSMYGGVEAVNLTVLLDQLVVGYDKRVRPNYGGIPVTVGVSLYVLSVQELSEQSMDFTIDMYFRQFWHDPRLAFERRPGLDKLVLGADFDKSIWVPDTFFVNERAVQEHKSPSDNKFLRILHTGEVLLSNRLTVKATCPLDLQLFPMDRQLCTLEIESFGFTMSDLRYRWQDGMKSVQMSPDVSLPLFNVYGHRQRIIEASLSSGNYSRLLVDVAFERALGHYVLQVYIPACFLVMISWLSFWLSKEEPTARIVLSAVPVFIISILSASVNINLPKISYTKSIDIFLGFCFLMNFLSLVQGVSVTYLARMIQLRKKKAKAIDDQKVLKDDICGLKPCYLDWLCRLIFPVVFVLFNVVYWAYSLQASMETVDDLIHLS